MVSLPPPRRSAGMADPSWGLAHCGESSAAHDPDPPTEYLTILGDLPGSTAAATAAAAERDRERVAALRALQQKKIPSSDYLDFLDRVLQGLRHI
ncbi:hypothetical protein ACRAKI_22255 [Saccharothrix isguenensis]